MCLYFCISDAMARMMKGRTGDLIAVFRGLNAVSRAAVNLTQAELKETWLMSSVRMGLKDVRFNLKTENISQSLSDAVGRSLAVARGLKEFSVIASQQHVPNSGKLCVAQLEIHLL